VALVAFDTAVELLHRQQGHDLRENRFASMHSSKLARIAASPFKSFPPSIRGKQLNADRLLAGAVRTLGH
jgi:hypothetical protein